MKKFLLLLIIFFGAFPVVVNASKTVNIADSTRISIAGEDALNSLASATDLVSEDTPLKGKLQQVFESELELQSDILAYQKLILSRPDWIVMLIGPDYRSLVEFRKLITKQKAILADVYNIRDANSSDYSIVVDEITAGFESQNQLISDFIDTQSQKTGLFSPLVQKLMSL